MIMQLSDRARLLWAGIPTLLVVATLVAMFFLISYGLLNYATFFEARTASPSWSWNTSRARPSATS